MSNRIVIGILVALFALIPLGPVAAQDFPSPNEQRRTLTDGGLPTAADLGSGWSLSSAFSDDDTFTFETHSATYADRFGSRIQIWAGLYDSRSESEALEIASYIMANIGANLDASDYAPTARELRALDDPRGCDMVERANGEDLIFYFFTGLISCHDTANDRVIVVIVSGLFDGERFHEATDPVLEIVLDIEPGGTSSKR